MPPKIGDVRTPVARPVEPIAQPPPAAKPAEGPPAADPTWAPRASAPRAETRAADGVADVAAVTGASTARPALQVPAENAPAPAAREKTDRVGETKKALDLVAVKLPKEIYANIQSQIDELQKAGKTKEVGELLTRTDGLVGFLNNNPSMFSALKGMEKASNAFDLVDNINKARTQVASGEYLDAMQSLAKAGGGAIGALPDAMLESVGKMAGGDPKAFAKFAKGFFEVEKQLTAKPPEYGKALTEGMEMIEHGLKALPKNGSIMKTLEGMTKKLGVEGEPFGGFVKAFATAQQNALSNPPDYGKVLGATFDLLESGAKMLPQGGSLDGVLQKLGNIPGVENAGPAAQALKTVLNNSKNLVELYQKWDQPSERLRLIPEVAKELGPEVVGFLVQRATGLEAAGEISKQLTQAMAGYVDDLGKQHIAANQGMSEAAGRESFAWATAQSELVAQGQKLGLSPAEADAFAMLKRDVGPQATSDLLLELRRSGNVEGLKAAVRTFMEVRKEAKGTLLTKGAVSDSGVPAQALYAASAKGFDVLVQRAMRAAPGSPERALMEALMKDQRALKGELESRMD
jgi:hypothetical protein